MYNTMEFIPWTQVKLMGGFWEKWQTVNAENTSRAIYNRFNDTGRINAMKLEWKEGMPDKPHWFWDSDIAKWMEGTAYILHFKKDAELEGYLNQIIGYIEKGQDANGYFNSAFLTLEPAGIFTDRTAHELYTAGHFIEAAVAHYYATGSNRFLDIMKKFADCIERAFVLEQSAKFKTPGHQELELALYRLWEATGEKRYLELSKYFVETRGKDQCERVFSVPNGTQPADPKVRNHLYYNDTYAQDDAPARELPGAAGHAVRAMYFYTAMADIANEYEDEELLTACKRLWNSSVNEKMYITGGVSADRYGEAIGSSYVLPNDGSYAETCASVAMANFSMRMFKMEKDSRYTDMIERQMYNGALVGVSMNGQGFFYDNTLLARPSLNDFLQGIHATPLFPICKRQEVFECSCCPPNIYRFLAVLGQYFYSVEADTLYVHQYAAGTATTKVQDTQVTLTQETNYPWEGSTKVTLELAESKEMTVAIRIPGWCKNPRISCMGETFTQTDSLKGYVSITRVWSSKDTILVEFPMETVLMEGNPKIVETTGRVAIMRGPLVYCLEETDNSFSVFDLTLPDHKADFACETIIIEEFPIVALKGKGLVRKQSGWENTLYRPIQEELEEVEFTAIPYFAWANRGVNNMNVWIH